MTRVANDKIYFDLNMHNEFLSYQMALGIHSNIFRRRSFYVSRTHYSDTHGPIFMKLLGFIELALNWCNVIFSISVSDFKPEIGQFFANRKFQSSKPEVEKYLVGKLVGFCNESPIFVF